MLAVANYTVGCVGIKLLLYAYLHSYVVYIILSIYYIHVDKQCMVHDIMLISYM